jgi:CheY-like chemotaxis protein
MNGHTILLVEDDPSAAVLFRELLVVLGYDVRHAASVEEARDVLSREDVCVVLMDLQILPTRDSAKPVVEAGLALFKELRGRFPRCAPEGGHLVPIIVMSGYANDHHYVTNAFRSGADDFLLKPLGENRVSLADTLRAALERAGRVEHAACAEVMMEAKRARSSVLPPPPSTRAPAPASVRAPAPPPVTLEVPGRVLGARRLVLVDGVEVWLTPGLFMLAVALVEGHLVGREWTERSALEGRTTPGVGGSSQLSRLAAKLAEAAPNGHPVLENNRQGGYRLQAHVKLGAIEVGRLADHHDRTLQKLARSILDALPAAPGASGLRA